MLSEIDIYYDDFERGLLLSDYENWSRNNQLKKVSSRFGCEGKGKYKAFFIGARNSKIMYIIDKESESRGEIKSVRYKMELHAAFAHTAADLICAGTFSFGEMIEKWFIKTVYNNLDEGKRKHSILPEWEQFIDKLKTVI